MNKFSFKPWIAAGINPDPYNATYQDSLVNAEGCRITPRGAELWEDFTLFPADTTVTYPFPQLFVGREGVYKFDQTDVYRMTAEDGTMGAVSLYTLARLASGYTFTNTSGATITGNAIWHMAMAGSHWVASNGVSNVIHFEGFSGAGTQKAFVSQDPFFTTCCEYNGKFLYGGIESLINSSWVTQLNTLKTYYNSESPDGDDNQVYFSSLDLESKFHWYWPWMLDSRKLQEIMNRRDSGFIGSGQRGAVLGLAPLGNGVICYGAEGISYLRERPEIRTFGREFVLDTGLKSRGAFTGNRQVQYFLDVEARLWRITADLKLELLDYSVELNSLSNVVMSFDSVKGDLYINSASVGYLLSQGRALSEIPQIVISPHRNLGADRAILKESSNQGFLIQTGEADLDGTRAAKFLHSLHIIGDNVDGLSVAVYGKIKADGTFTLLKSATISGSPIIDIGKTVIAMYVVVSKASHLVQIDDIVAEWDYFPIGLGSY